MAAPAYYQTLTDGELDSAFAACWDIGDYASANLIGEEIRSRLVTFGSFIAGIFGQSRFPLYEARTGFSQAGAAQSSTAQSARNLATTAGQVVQGAGSALKSGLFAAGGGAAVVVIVAGVLYFGVLRKK